MKFVFAQVSEVKAVKSQGVARVSLDVPIEQFKDMVNALHEQKVLMFTGDFNVPQFGVFAIDFDEEEFRHLMDQAVGGVPPPVERLGRDRGKADSIASKMHKNGYFLNRRLWAAIAEAKLWTEEMHHELIKTLPCVMDAANDPEQAARLHRLAGTGKFTGCQGEVVGHHIRTAENSGKNMKPQNWFEVPACHGHHREVFHDGQTADLNAALLELSVGLTAFQMKMAFKRALGISTLSGIEQHQVDEFERLVKLHG